MYSGELLSKEESKELDEAADKNNNIAATTQESKVASESNDKHPAHEE